MLLFVGDWRLWLQALTKIRDKIIFDWKISSGQEGIIHQLVHMAGLETTDENANLFSDPQIIQILNVRLAIFFFFFYYYARCQCFTNLWEKMQICPFWRMFSHRITQHELALCPFLHLKPVYSKSLFYQHSHFIWNRVQRRQKVFMEQRPNR